MLNRVILMGRITQDLEVRQTPSGVSVLSFTVAVDRSFVRQGEDRQTDFINCVAWRNQAEFIGKYFSKGRLIALEGNLRTRNYDDKNGVKHYVTEVFVDSVSFTGGRASQGQDSAYSYSGSRTQQSQSQQPAYNEQSSGPIAIGNLDDFEEILSDDGIPF